MYLPVEWPVPDLVSRRAAAIPERTALIDTAAGSSWSYDELSTGPVDALAAGIRGRDVTPGDHLGVLLSPGAQMAQLVYAAARAGVVLVPLSPDAPVEVLRKRCSVADVDAVVCSPASERTAIRAFDGAVFSVESDESAIVESLWSQTTHQPAYRWARDEVQWLVFTSGTLGEPEAVQLTAGNLLASATASAFRLGVDPGDRWLSCLPMHHVSGLGPLVRSALYGTAVVVQSGFDVERTADAMASFEITGISLVPTMLSRLLDAEWTPPPSLRFVLLGGAPATLELIERSADRGVPVYPTYGTTETASQIATASNREALEYPGTVGRPLMGTHVTVLDEDYDPLPPGNTGELVVAGPTVSPGYYGEDGETAWRFEERGFHTRDLGHRDEAGRLWVRGRTDDAIITGGETVQPGEVEAAIRAHPAVADVAVIGLSDEEWGQVVAVVVSTPTGTDVEAEALRDHCRVRLEPYAVPKVVHVADDLPRTASGTIDRNAVRDMLT